MEKKLNKIKVVIPFYNPGEFLDMCINSVLTQEYDNFEVLFIDDCSTDNSYNKIPSCTFKMKDDGTQELDSGGNPIILKKDPILEITKCKNIVAWRSNQRNTALPNIHNGVMNFCTDPNDLVIIVDGDDWLPNKNVLSYINDYYNEHDNWILYGSAKWTDGRPPCSSSYTMEEFKNIRKASFRVSHIRSFRAGLYHQILVQDQELKTMKDENGEFYKSSYDTNMFFSLLELAGFEKTKHTEKILYVYNRSNPISDDKVNQQLQLDVHREVSNKKPLKQIKDYITGELVN